MSDVAQQESQPKTRNMPSPEEREARKNARDTLKNAILERKFPVKETIEAITLLLGDLTAPKKVREVTSKDQRILDWIKENVEVGGTCTGMDLYMNMQVGPVEVKAAIFYGQENGYWVSSQKQKETPDLLYTNLGESELMPADYPGPTKQVRNRSK